MKYSLWTKERLPLARLSASEVFVTFRRDLKSYLPGDRPRTPALCQHSLQLATLSMASPGLPVYIFHSVWKAGMVLLLLW